jgi:hypothetical protein
VLHDVAAYLPDRRNESVFGSYELYVTSRDIGGKNVSGTCRYGGSQSLNMVLGAGNMQRIAGTDYTFDPIRSDCPSSPA